MEQFGRYQLVRLVGMGGMAQVHLARQTGPDGYLKPCVLKRIAPEHHWDPEVRRMFLEEARVSALLNHPHIVQTFDYGTVGDAPFMAMELVDGVNLAQLLRRLAREGRWLGLRPGLEIITHILDALDYAHHLSDLDGKPLRIVHRDVSPQNILLSRQGGVKLADFGIARHEARDEVTLGATTKGKPGYMPPEQALGAAVDARADIFATGVLLAELVSGRRVKQPGDLAAGYAQLPGRISRLMALEQAAPPGLPALVRQMTALEPGERPSSARSVSDALRELALAIPDRDSLQRFLERVFAQLAPDPSAPPSQDAEPTLVDAELPPPPPSSDSQLRFEEASWTAPSPEPPSPAASLYDRGWPTQYLNPPASPPLAAAGGDAKLLLAVQSQAALAAPAPPTPPPPPRAAAIATAPPPPPSPAPRSPALGARSAPPPRQRAPRGLYFKAGVSLLLIAGLAVGVLSLSARSSAPRPAPAAIEGRLTVISTPPGADIVLDGQRTGKRTPAELRGLEVGRSFRVGVALLGHLSTPREAQLTLSEHAPKNGASFTLVPGRVFRVETEPAGAWVMIGGERLREVTPLELPALPLGESSTLTVGLEGHLPVVRVLHARAGTATVTALKLEAGKEIDLVSEPPGARVLIDRTARGTTPLYDLIVPLERPFKVTLKKRGYRSWSKTTSVKQLQGRLIEADLGALPLLALPMARAELTQAKDLDRRQSRLRGEVTRAKAGLAQAERSLAEAEAHPDFFRDKLIRAQSSVDQLRARLERSEAELQLAEQELEAMREKLLLRLDGNADQEP